ncbi:hypothetical protein CKAN_01139800 [Cinnamomum micranthum f. kanehirae]|uniref:Neprosin PEP catalytic domain-containing protein n=1 Tax=Cinnamomum micranthum f. kanehirae TaxID=337451 RepID=A0A3S3NMH3_9MAGN|nr:hypothetical protein CKAN_01139800 [Cinnamomum micranthum f. kanehirae]
MTPRTYDSEKKASLKTIEQLYWHKSGSCPEGTIPILRTRKNTRGCYNLKCSGFIQTNKHVVLGGGVSPTSTYGGIQFPMHVKIRKDLLDNWWLELSGHYVGYWPGSMIKNMETSADLIQWGGQVWNSAPGGTRTSTQMGSGHFAKEGYGKAAFLNDYKFRTMATKPSCYSISKVLIPSKRPGVNFFYGGPGGPGCAE